MLFIEGKLHSALKMHDVEFAKKCIKSGGVCKKPWLEMFLSESVFFNDIEHIHTYLKCGLDIEAHVNSENETMLHLAARIGREKIVDFLIANGAKSDVYNKNKTSVLYDTADHNSPVSAYIINVLVKNGVPIDYQDPRHLKTALIAASTHCNATSMQALIDLGANLDLTNSEDNTAWSFSNRRTALLFPQHKVDDNEVVTVNDNWVWRSKSGDAVTHSQTSQETKELIIDVFNFASQKVHSTSTNRDIKIKSRSTTLFAEYPDKDMLKTACIEYNKLSGTDKPVDSEQITQLTVKIIDGTPTNKVKIKIGDI